MNDSTQDADIISDRDDVKPRLIAVRSCVQQTVIDDAVNQWRENVCRSVLLCESKRLSLCTLAVTFLLRPTY